MKEENKTPACDGCIKFEKFGKQCHVHWEDKKICTLKARNEEEWQEQTRVLNTR